MIRRFAFDESSIYMNFLLVIDSLFDFISFKFIAVLLVRLYLYIALSSLHNS